MIAAHPEIPARLIIDGRITALNPKVNNLANIIDHARGSVILISDANVRAEEEYLGDLVAQLQQPGVRLVSSPFRGVSERSVGGACEELQLNTFVMGGVCAVHELWGGVCVVGKSMLLRREDLEAIGGLPFLGRFLAEDQVCGEEIAAAGGRLALSSKVVDNVIGHPTMRGFLARHLRWAKIRWRINPAGYLGELLLNPVFLAAIQVGVERSPFAVAILAATLMAKSLLDASVERSLGVRRPLFTYPGLVLLKDLAVGALWIWPLFSQRVRWRGNPLRIGPRTELLATSPAEATAEQPLTPERAVG